MKRGIAIVPKGGDSRLEICFFFAEKVPKGIDTCQEGALYSHKYVAALMGFFKGERKNADDAFAVSH